MTCNDCIHRSVCYRLDSVQSDHARKCGDFVSGCKSFDSGSKAERKKIAEDVANKMDYMGSCLNEKNIILGIITGKRETLDSLCSVCKSEDCVSNGTAISKADYENRLKADMIAILGKIRAEIERGKTGLDIEFNGGIDYAISIIDKYKTESKVQE